MRGNLSASIMHRAGEARSGPYRPHLGGAPPPLATQLPNAFYAPLCCPQTPVGKLSAADLFVTCNRNLALKVSETNKAGHRSAPPGKCR